MGIDEAKAILIKHTQFFDIYAIDLEVPRCMEGTIGEIKAAMDILVPGFSKVHCSTCSGEWIKEANRHRLAALKEPKFYTFPKQ